jgi:hypothetical protein
VARDVAIGISVVLALVLAGLLVWYFAFRSEDEEEPVAGRGSVFASATALDFGDEPVGGTSPSQTIRIVNAGDGALALGQIELAGDNPGAFALTDDTDCAEGRTLAPEDACSLVLQFLPPDRGVRSALLLVVHTGDGSPLEIALRGTGAGEALPALSTTRVEFGELPLGQRAEAQEVTLTNGGTVPLEIVQILIRGETAGDFPLADGTTCTDEETVAPGESCLLAIAFRPGALGPRTANLVLRHSASDEPIRVALSGSGRGQPKSALEPSQLDLGEADVGSAGVSGSVTLANRGTAPLTIDAIVLSGPAAADYSLGDETTCSTEAQVGNGESCTIHVVFAPAAGGPRAATLLVVHDAPARVSTLELEGEGLAAVEPPVEPPPEEPPATTDTTATTG